MQPIVTVYFEACTRFGFCDENVVRAIVPAYSGAQCRFGSLADMAAIFGHVRSYPESGHRDTRRPRLLSAISCREHVQQNAVLFDDFVGAGEQRWRNGKAERFDRFVVDHQLIFGWRLNRKIGRPRALKDAINVSGSAPVLVKEVRAVRRQPAAG